MTVAGHTCHAMPAPCLPASSSSSPLHLTSSLPPHITSHHPHHLSLTPHPHSSSHASLFSISCVPGGTGRWNTAWGPHHHHHHTPTTLPPLYLFGRNTLRLISLKGLAKAAGCLFLGLPPPSHASTCLGGGWWVVAWRGTGGA